MWYNRSIRLILSETGRYMDENTAPRRSERILVSVTPEMKKRLKNLAKKRVWSLSQTAYMILLEGFEAMDARRGTDEESHGET